MPTQSFGEFVATQPAPKQSFGDFVATQPSEESKPPESLTHSFLKYSPIGMAQSVADAIRDPKHAIAGILNAPKENVKLLDKARESYGKGEYGSAAVHFLNYLMPGGSAMEDAGESFEKGDTAQGIAKTAGIASTLAAGVKGPAVLDAAAGAELPSIPSLPSVKNAASVAHDVLNVSHSYNPVTRALAAKRLFDRIKTRIETPEAAAATPDAGQSIMESMRQSIVEAEAAQDLARLRGVSPSASPASTPTPSPAVVPPSTTGAIPRDPVNMNDYIGTTQPYSGPFTPPDPAPSSVPAPARVPVWQGIQPSGQVPQPVPAPPEVALPSGRIPGSLRTPGNFQGMEETRPVEPASIEPKSSVKANTDSLQPEPKSDLESQLEKSLGLEPNELSEFATAVNAEVDQHLKQEAAKKTAEIVDSHQTKRALKLGKFLQEHEVPLDHIERMTDEDWHTVGELADVKKPSATTIQKTKDLLNMGREEAPKPTLVKKKPPASEK